MKASLVVRAWGAIEHFSLSMRFRCVNAMVATCIFQQAANNSKEQFANSPDLSNALLNAIMEALEANTSMSTEALDSQRVRDGLRYVAWACATICHCEPARQILAALDITDGGMKLEHTRFKRRHFLSCAFRPRTR